VCYNKVGGIMKKLIAYLLVIMVMVIIFLFSSQTGNTSGNLSTSFIAHIIKFFSPHISDSSLEALVITLLIPIRKLAHFTIYFILGLTVSYLLSLYKLPVKGIIIIGLLICIFYACTDEIHQLFIDGRGASIIDVSIDSTGSLLALFLSTILLKKRKMLE
jgi:VanZ family protein